MHHKFNDYTKLGGAPITQDWLQHDFEGVYKTIMALFENSAANAIVISGSLAGSAWLYMNGEILPYVAPDPMILIPPGSAPYIVPQETAITVPYEDGSLNASYKRTRIAVLEAHATPPPGGVLQSSFKLFVELFGKRGRADAWSMESFTTSVYNGFVRYKKDLLSNCLLVRGQVTILSTCPTGNPYYVLTTLPATHRPAVFSPFTAHYMYSMSAIKDHASVQYIDQLNGDLTIDGKLRLGMRRPETPVTDYQVFFNTIIPLD
jgi:hypothetical protein